MKLIAVNIISFQKAIDENVLFFMTTQVPAYSLAFPWSCSDNDRYREEAVKR